MSRLIKALKALGKKCNTGSTEPEGKTLSEVISSIAENFNITGAAGADGDDGASVTAIALTTTEGAVTGGTATLSDGTTVEITVTEATAAANPGET